PDPGRIWTGHLDGSVRLWDYYGWHLRRCLKGGHEGICRIDLSPDGRWLAAWGMKGRIQLWETVSGRLVQTLTGTRGADNEGATFSADGRLLVLPTERDLLVYRQVP